MSDQAERQTRHVTDDGRWIHALEKAERVRPEVVRKSDDLFWVASSDTLQWYKVRGNPFTGLYECDCPQRRDPSLQTTALCYHCGAVQLWFDERQELIDILLFPELDGEVIENTHSTPGEDAPELLTA